jgi:uncharacterized membrane protein YebE (DUF533 family)
MKKAAFISVGLIALAGIAYLLYNKYGKKASAPTTNNQQPTTNKPWQNNITVTGTNMQSGGDFNWLPIMQQY